MQTVKEHLEKLEKVERYTQKVRAFRREVKNYIEWKHTPKGGNDLVRRYPTEEEEAYAFAVVSVLGQQAGLDLSDIIDYVRFAEEECTQIIDGRHVVELEKL